MRRFWYGSLFWFMVDCFQICNAVTAGAGRDFETRDGTD